MWRNSRYMSYDGECLTRTKKRISDHIIVGGADETEELSKTHCWTFNWVSPSDITSPSDPLRAVEGMESPLKAPTTEQLLIMSPCLCAFFLSSNTWIPISVDNIRPLDLHHDMAAPVIDEDKLKPINSVVEFNTHNNALRASVPLRNRGNGVVILLHGAPGLGKTYTVEYISNKTRRPLVVLNELQQNKSRGNMEQILTKWFALGEKWNAIFLIDNCEEIFDFHAKDKRRDAPQQALRRALKLFNGLLFLTTNRIGGMDDRLSSFIDLMIHLEKFDFVGRRKIWHALEERFCSKDERIILSRSATTFMLHSAPQIEFNGHEMNQCFKTAIALATSVPRQQDSEDGDIVTIETEHLKEAMNLIYEFRQYIASIHGDEAARALKWEFRNDNFEYGNRAQFPGRLPPLPPPLGFPGARTHYPVPPQMRQYADTDRSFGDRPSSPPPKSQDPHRDASHSNNSGDSSPCSDDDASAKSKMRPDPSPKLRAKSSKKAPRPLTSGDDWNLCIPELNFVRWDDFQTAAFNSPKLFRKKEFHAVDVLVGEPMVRMESVSTTRRRRNMTPRSASPVGETVADVDADEAPLPERIRINSPALFRAITDINIAKRCPGPVLLFRPFRILVYYEQDLREWATKQEKLIGECAAKGTESGSDDDEDYEKKLYAGLQDMRCLLSFIDNFIKKRQQYIASNRCEYVTFSILPFLYNPGDFVIDKEERRAFQVFRVYSLPHRMLTRPAFWTDETFAKFDNNPFVVYCKFLDANGTHIGPVSSFFIWNRFEGKRKITSFEIYPFQYSKHTGLRNLLIERGKVFLEVAGTKHMHYSGLSIDTREEIDSQVVIDFEEALDRFPRWASNFAPFWGESLESFAEDNDFSDESDEDISRIVDAQKKSKKTTCVRECCTDEYTIDDRYLEKRMEEEFTFDQLKKAASVASSASATVSLQTPTIPLSLSATPLTFAKKSLRDVVNDGTITDDDFLILPFRVFGFVLRSRKWHKLDLENISEVAILGEGEGLDQLVLPSGHLDMVKSMIRQHFREKTLATMNSGKLDVVRGKGRGLIMLLHGVPGVGKTSTAECVADSFRRPLFQITSGDLGSTAEEVEETLEENFNLANRWNSILLIDEADVFLGERTREDFVRNSLVAVFLRMMEYYAGVLFLTTNRVGVFDEAFTSRIHISLYYPPLERDATLQIFEKNWERIKSRYEKNNRKLEIKTPEITQFALDYFDSNKEGRWNGRQIRNAFQSALALAELDALGTDDLLDDRDHGRTVVLGKKNFETVAHAYKGFLDYLKQVYGADFGRRARENLWRYDAFGIPKAPNALTTRLKVAEPGPSALSPSRVPPGPGPQQAWVPAGPPQPQAGYGYREPQPPSSYYQPQQPPPPHPPQHQHPQPQYYAERYEHRDQRPRYMPSQDPYAPPAAPQDRFTAPALDPYAQGAERYTAGPERIPPTPVQSYRTNTPRESDFHGREADNPR
ncbi:P-loop containing nucleoside triphosphate hydrolase protein [Apiospora arundinis]|uniref:P-loop containing nucleoside triphosphate hydrolase protein n=1 Tax=Apiospora arundinis TaxID=335852 RepID=A0ABR2JBU3_9PEZI